MPTVDRDLRALVERHKNLVKTGAAYAAGELRGAPTSTFEIYIGHFREIGREIESALDALTAAESALSASGAPGPVAWQYRWKGVAGEWSDWITTDLDPNDWTWPFYWKDLETRPLYAHPQASSLGWSEQASDIEYEVWQHGEPAASSTDYNDALHYLAMYSQDGPVEFYKTVRTPIALPAAAPLPAQQEA